MNDMIPYLYVGGGALIAFASVLVLLGSAKPAGSTGGSLTLKRILAVLALFVGAVLMAQGFAHF